MKRDVSGHKGFAPQNMQRDSDLEQEQILNTIAGQSPIDRLVTISILFANEHSGGVLCTRTLCSWIATYQCQLGLSSIHNWEDIYKRLLQNTTSELKYANKRRSFKLDNKKTFARHTLKKEGYEIREYIADTNDFKRVKELIKGKDADSFREFSINIFNEAGL